MTQARTSLRRRGLVVVAAAVLGVVLLSIALGSKALSLPEVWHGLWTPTGAEGDVIVRSLRLPRTALALVAGCALGVAGALMQGHTRNPIADPVLLGVSAGAGMFVAGGIFLLGVTTLYGYVWFGFAGAFLASAIVYFVGNRTRGGATPVTLALGGAAVHALFTALTAGMLILDEQALELYRFWTVGSVSGRPAEITAQMLPFVVAGLVLAAANARGLNSLSLGEDVARALGVRVGLTRLVGMAAITLLTGVAVAACGPIGFVGLMAAHIARSITGPDYRWVLLYSALVGMALMVAADVLGRLVARPSELPVGIMLAFIGAPVFIYLIRRRKPVRL
ncbi:MULTISPECIES: FecCD family ABC transporter permease [Actinokineospora]|uniref:Iron ABC transporter permease n=1 Tax=Actinokineospora fastidiosa TaxID=1816 RepID=A0A918GMP5_9PSEU|nr:MULTISPECIES: iron ABC transporter permease [Actinokineospora]UVS78224.1 putative siderophore transport system permease protein YfiZ precursor [Actinokineospora sp. UTMC 2448]GGS48758.1 iron ABC transporter permease [Actinokineospora fastidiosa]